MWALRFWILFINNFFKKKQYFPKNQWNFFFLGGGHFEGTGRRTTKMNTTIFWYRIQFFCFFSSKNQIPSDLNPKNWFWGAHFTSYLCFHFFNFFFYFCEVGLHCDSRTQTCWPVVLYLSFKFVVGCLGVQPRSCPALPLLFVPNPWWQSPRSASLPFPMSGIHTKCILMFPFLHHISRMRESLPSISRTLCNVSHPLYLWTEHSYQLVPPDTVGWSHTFTDFPFCLFPFFNPIPYFGPKPA